MRVGTLDGDGDGEPVRVAGFDAEGYRRQTVTVNGPVEGGTGSGAGVFLAGDTPGADDGDPAIKPKLYVDLNLDGRRVSSVIGDDWIINDGGETTIVVNIVKLHDGATGVVPGASAPNGAFDITIRDDGLT